MRERTRKLQIGTLSTQYLVQLVQIFTRQVLVDSSEDKTPQLLFGLPLELHVHLLTFVMATFVAFMHFSIRGLINFYYSTLTSYELI